MNHSAARRRLLIALGALGCAAPTRADDDLTRLFAELGARRERHARFVERKFSGLLKAPIESSGTMIFRAPDILERRTIEPQRESVRIQGSVVTYEGAPVRGQIQKRTFTLADAPLLAALVESLRATLAGNLVELRRHYDVNKTGAGQAWGLTLIPRERALRDAVERIQLRGTGSEVNEVEIVEASGDLTLLRIFSLPTPAK